ncbi:hypothetical protein M514_09293, partial [Trichuris suis]
CSTTAEALIVSAMVFCGCSRCGRPRLLVLVRAGVCGSLSRRTASLHLPTCDTCCLYLSS